MNNKILQKGATYGESMERKYLKYLIKWVEDEDRKPLLVLGARQVGKSYLIEELFAKKYFISHYQRIDCSDDQDFVNYVYNQLCNDYNVNISYINNEYDFTIEFSRIDRNEIGEINGELSKEELVVLSVFKNNRNAIKKDIINETRYSSRTIDRIIRSLKDKELIKRIGSNKNGYWEVLK